MVRKIISKVRKKTNNYIAAGILLTVLTACSQGKVYDEYRELPNEGWSRNMIAKFEVDIKDTRTPHNVLINIRHNDGYPYQNFWMFVTTKTPDGITTKDTVECYLADNRGKWLGSGLSSVYNMPVLFKPNKVFPKAGKYTFTVYQGMRDDLLKGISDVGIEIDRAK